MAAMVGVAGQDATGPVYLFAQHRPDQHMRPGQRTERQGEIGPLQDGRRKAVGAADHEGEIPCTGVLPAADPCRQRLAVQWLSAGIECHCDGAVRHRGQQQVALAPAALITTAATTVLDLFQMYRPGMARGIVRIQRCARIPPGPTA